MRRLGIGTAEESNTAREMLAFRETSLLNNTINAIVESVSANPLDRIEAYATVCAKSGRLSSLHLKLLKYHKFVLIAACVVLLKKGVDETAVFTRIRVAFGKNFTTAYMLRLCKTCRWVMGHFIDSLSLVWGSRTGELLLWCMCETHDRSLNPDH